MSFLNQLKSQASALQNQQHEPQNLAALTQACELACTLTYKYFDDLARQLNVLQPATPKLSVDGKTQWPAMKMKSFMADSRKTMLRGKEAYVYVAMGWDMAPAVGGKLVGSVKVNFPPDLERVQKRLDCGAVKHERKDVRDPATNKLLAYEFVYECLGRGSIMVEPEHDTGQIKFRLLNLTGFEVINTVYPAVKVDTALLDELAKLLVGQPSRFV